MATGTTTSSFSAREKTNFTRLSRLLIEVGRRVFQDVFDSMHPPSTLNTVLNSVPVKNQLLKLSRSRVIHKQQWNLLYPNSGIAQSKDFDITLLFLLLRNICGLRAPSTGWDIEPSPANLTLEADLVRIKCCRNMLYAHKVEMALTDDEFENYWDKIEAALNRLGRSKYGTQIEHLKFASMDHQMDCCFYALLQSWEEANLQERTIIINGTIKTLTAGGTVLAWAAGSAYFLMRYREDPETVIRLVQEAIIPSGLAASAIVYALLPGSFKILVYVNPGAVDYILRSFKDENLEKNLEKVIITDDLSRLVPGGTKKVLISVTLSDYEDFTAAVQEIPKVLPKDPRRVHVIGLSDRTSKDGLMSFMEVASDEEVKSMLFGEHSNVMVTFEHPPDFERIIQKCKHRALDGRYLRVEQVSVCDCIEVSGLASSTTSDTIIYYFENTKKSGGGVVKRVDYSDGEPKALVFFEDFQDVENVVTHKHVIDGETLKVAPYYPFLGETSQEPRAKMSDTDEEKLVRHMPYEGHVRLSVLLTPDAINGNNYKLLADKLGFTVEEIKNLETKREPVMELLQDHRCLDLTIAKLKSKLSEMERKDAITDLETFEDQTPTPSEYERKYKERAKTGLQEEFQRLTVLPDDIKYDAFICYCKRDVQFAKELLRKLEANPYHLKLCIDYRDILPGGEKLSTVVNVIEERCRKVIVIVSKHFSEDVDADFQAKIALSLSPGCKEKRLIPIVYDDRKYVPAILRHITHLDYTNKVAREYFWPNLARSLGYKD